MDLSGTHRQSRSAGVEGALQAQHPRLGVVADQPLHDARDVDEELWDDLQTQFDDGEIVEIASVIGLFNFLNRFADALQILPPSNTTKE